MLEMGRIKKRNQPSRSTWLKFVLLSFGIWILSGCVSLIDPETIQYFNQDIVATINSEHSVGQTLVSRRPFFNGINLWFRTPEDSVPVNVSLYNSPGDSIPLQHIKIQAINGINEVNFDPQSDLPNQHYYIHLTVDQSEIQLLGRNEDNYTPGTAFMDGLPIDGDLAFQASYDYELKGIFQDLWSFLSLWKFIIPLCFLLIFPGWLLLDLTKFRKDLDLGEQVAISLGLSIAIIPIIMVWTTVVGLKWSSSSIWVVCTTIFVVILWRIWVTTKRLSLKGFQGLIVPNLSSSSNILLCIFFVSLFVRFAMVRDIFVPPWVDSIHHSIFTEIIIETGGFPDNYLPHIPIEGNKYHAGYHSLLASFIWLTGADVSYGMLVHGQVLNALMVFGVYLFTKTLVNDDKTSLIAASITGVLSLMPAYYVSWGRYTQLTGLLVLPAAFKLVVTLPKSKNKTSFLILGALLLAGLFVIHYRVMIFLGCLILSYWVGILYKKNEEKWKHLVTSIKYTGFLGLISITLVIPWLIPTIKEFVIPLSYIWIPGRPDFQNIHWNYLTPGYGIGIMVTAFLGLILGLIKREMFSLIQLLWVLSLIGIANPRYFRIPFPGGMINQSSVDIMLFIPFSVLSGYFTSQVTSFIQKILEHQRRFFRTALFVVPGILIVLSGSRLLLKSLNPITILFREEDRYGIDWVKENIPINETIVINPAPWGYGMYMGQDGGFWISPMTNHRTIPPNATYGLSLAEINSGNQFVEEIIPLGENPQDLWKLLQRNDLEYIFIGSRGGIISPLALHESNLFETLYNKNNNWVFKTVNDP